MRDIYVSVVTVVYNSQNSIAETIESIISCKTPNVEYIVVDGGSSDETLNRINNYSTFIDYIISEPDDGIYNAMNKGIQLAQGKYIIFINAGDKLISIPNFSLFEISKRMICFPVTVTGGKKRIPRANYLLKVINTLPHQGVFYRNDKLLKFEEKYRIFADYAFNLNVYLKNKNDILVYKFPIVAHHSLDGVSNSKVNNREFFRVVKENEGTIYVLLSWLNFKFRGLFFLIKRFVRI